MSTSTKAFQKHANPLLRYRTILVPHDFSENSAVALAHAAELAAVAQSRLHLLHVMAPSALGPTAEGRPLAEPSLEARRIARSALEQIARRLDAGAELHVVHGIPAHAICALAIDIRADLIVMGTHTRSGLARVVLGSTAVRTLHHAPCPVLTVRTDTVAARKTYEEPTCSLNWTASSSPHATAHPSGMPSAPYWGRKS